MRRFAACLWLAAFVLLGASCGGDDVGTRGVSSVSDARLGSALPPVPIFSDDFELGDLSRWSSFSPAVTLSLTNYISWCSFSVNGGVPSAAASLSAIFPPGEIVDLHADPADASFIWGYWTGTDGDNGSSHDTNQSTTVTMDADKSILACCPLSLSPGPCS